MRTRFFALMLGLFLPVLPLQAGAADAYVEGEHYARLSTPQPAGEPGKVEVVEMFWYGCPHCYAFEPYIHDWLERKPDNVEYIRMPAIFNNPKWRLHAAGFYTAEVLGVVEKIHGPLFDALHKFNRPLNSEEKLMAFFAEHGVSNEEFKKTFHSFAVQSKVNRAADLSRRFGLSGVPAMIVNGKYRIEGPMAKTYENMLDIVDFLAAKELAAGGQ